MSVVLGIVFPAVGLSLENPTATNPLGLGTVPPTAYKSGLIPSINPVDTSGNLVVTGNVANGMYFRGVVPYQGATDFIAPASSLSHTSAAIDSFLRNSAGSQNFGRPAGGIIPYYSPTWTVTTTTIGGTVFTPQSVSNRSVEPFSGVNLPREQTGYYQREYVPQVDNRPLSMSQQELERIIDIDTGRYPQGGESVSQVQSQEQFWRHLGVQMERRAEPPTGSVEEVGQLRSATGAEPNVGMLLGFRAGQEKQSAAAGRAPDGATAGQQELQQFANTLEPNGVPGVYEQMKMKLGEPAMDMGEMSKATSDWATGQADANKPVVPGVSRAGVSTLGAGGFAEAYKSFAAFSNDKFNKHIRAAESYMKQGRFYRAADAYTLAAVYKPDDPLGYAGKSYALFAAGEYMSSALFLARAIEIFPEYAKLKIDLAGMVGDKDTVENRILEARDWLDRSGSGELEFLLSYVYYQMDRLEFARIAIESAAKKMPDSKAVAAMKKAIDERVSKL
jgi:tetratricopeptide (TPR) repeat protein